MGVPSVKSGASAFAVPRVRAFKSPLDKAKGYEVVWQQVAAIFDTARTIPCQFVYVIGEVDDGPVKIGLSKDPIGRLRNMQTGNARRLRVEHVLIGDMRLEKLLHEMWERFAIISTRQKGKVDAPPGTEWFKPEIRELLDPIMRTAAEMQMAWVDSVEDGQYSLDDAEKAVRAAHGAHDFVAQKRDEVLLMGASSGTYCPRPSRI